MPDSRNMQYANYSNEIQMSVQSPDGCTILSQHVNVDNVFDCHKFMYIMYLFIWLLWCIDSMQSLQGLS